MTIKSNGKVMVLAKNKRESNDGRSFYYNLAIIIDGEAGNLSCTEDAYNKAEANALNGVVYAYNEQYKSFRIIDIVPESSVPDRAQPDAAPGSKPDKPSGAK